eukprot:m.29251 g.29251  ORF g.29251 m.29251 type:complete len:223 (-) comp8081_c0_seq1:98-766(-)
MAVGTQIAAFVLLCFLSGPTNIEGLRGGAGPQLVVTGNPHMPHEKSFEDVCLGGAGGCEAEFLNPAQLAGMPVNLAVQQESFAGIRKIKYMGMPVDVYKFNQPRSLSHLQLPFKLVLVRSLNLADVEVVEVPPTQGLNSWFLGYHWSILACNKCNRITHLGWKFTSNSDPEDFFFALIVDLAEEPQEERVDATVPLVDVVTELLKVGMRGPSWLVSMMSAKD